MTLKNRVVGITGAARRKNLELGIGRSFRKQR